MSINQKAVQFVKLLGEKLLEEVKEGSISSSKDWKNVFTEALSSIPHGKLKRELTKYKPLYFKRFMRCVRKGQIFAATGTGGTPFQTGSEADLFNPEEDVCGEQKSVKNGQPEAYDKKENVAVRDNIPSASSSWNPYFSNIPAEMDPEKQKLVSTPVKCSPSTRTGNLLRRETVFLYHRCDAASLAAHMDKAVRHFSAEVINILKSKNINRASKVSKCLHRMMLYFHFKGDILQSQKVPSKRDAMYWHHMADLLSLYFDLKTLLARTGEEGVRPVALKTLSRACLLLQDRDQLMDAVLKLRDPRPADAAFFHPILTHVVKHPPAPLTPPSYLKYILVCRLARSVLQEERYPEIAPLIQSSLGVSPPRNLSDWLRDRYPDLAAKILAHADNNQVTSFLLQVASHDLCQRLLQCLMSPACPAGNITERKSRLAPGDDGVDAAGSTCFTDPVATDLVVVENQEIDSEEVLGDLSEEENSIISISTKDCTEATSIAKIQTQEASPNGIQGPPSVTMPTDVVDVSHKTRGTAQPSFIYKALGKEGQEEQAKNTEKQHEDILVAQLKEEIEEITEKERGSRKRKKGQQMTGVVEVNLQGREEQAKEVEECVELETVEKENKDRVAKVERGDSGAISEVQGMMNKGMVPAVPFQRDEHNIHIVSSTPVITQGNSRASLKSNRKRQAPDSPKLSRSTKRRDKDAERHPSVVLDSCDDSDSVDIICDSDYEHVNKLQHKMAARKVRQLQSLLSPSELPNLRSAQGQRVSTVVTRCRSKGSDFLDRHSGCTFKTGASMNYKEIRKTEESQTLSPVFERYKPLDSGVVSFTKTRVQGRKQENGQESQEITVSGESRRSPSGQARCSGRRHSPSKRQQDVGADQVKRLWPEMQDQVEKVRFDWKRCREQPISTSGSMTSPGSSQAIGPNRTTNREGSPAGRNCPSEATAKVIRPFPRSQHQDDTVRKDRQKSTERQLLYSASQSTISSVAPHGKSLEISTTTAESPRRSLREHKSSPCRFCTDMPVRCSPPHASCAIKEAKAQLATLTNCSTSKHYPMQNVSPRGDASQKKFTSLVEKGFHAGAVTRELVLSLPKCRPSEEYRTHATLREKCMSSPKRNTGQRRSPRKRSLSEGTSGSRSSASGSSVKDVPALGGACSNRASPRLGSASGKMIVMDTQMDTQSQDSKSTQGVRSASETSESIKSSVANFTPRSTRRQLRVLHSRSTPRKRLVRKTLDFSK